MRRFLFAATVAAVSLRSAMVNAAEFTRFDDHGLVISGDIVKGDALRFATEIGIGLVHPGQAYGLVLLNSDGGLVAEGVRLAEMIHLYGLKTGIARGDKCASICALLFAAGTERWMSGGGALGVHSVSRLGRTTEDEAAMAATLFVGRRMVSYGMPAEIVDKVALATGNNVYWLGFEDLTSWVHFAQE